MASERGVVKVPVKDATRKLTLKVKLTGVRRLVWRLKVARWLFLLGGKVAGLKTQVDFE